VPDIIDKYLYCLNQGTFAITSETNEIEDDFELRFHEDCQSGVGVGHTDIILI
jgi:hypothetical protein